MRWMLWLMGLCANSLPSSCLLARTRTPLHPRQEKFLEQLSSYEIVTPTRLNEFGEPFPADAHFRWRQRSPRSALPFPARTHYRIAAFGQDFRLQLTADASFVGPSFHVTHLGWPDSGNGTGGAAPTPADGGGGGGGGDFAFEEEEDVRSCFYTGHVNAQPEFTAVLSLCTGLLGTFRTGDAEYFVEPLLLLAEEEAGGEDERSKPHVVYRRDALAAAATATEAASHQVCGVPGHSRQATAEQKMTLKVTGTGPGSVATATAIVSARATNDSAGGGGGREPSPWASEAAEENKQQRQRQQATREPGGRRQAGKRASSSPPPRSGRARRRRKRFLSYPRHVEVMVAADARMVQHHGHNLQHYVLTLVSIVASIYKHPSVGNQINIVLVKLMIIHNEREGPLVTFNAASTLSNFCVWQQKQNTQDESHPSHHDTAVLITRENICRARNKCDTLGLAELGTMCDPYRSCSISEDNGLSTAFTVAHEIGHVFNMPHDDNNKCREAGVKGQFHVMAPTLNYNTNPWTWSRCSRKYITEFLDTGYGECLLDEPVSQPYELPKQMPGHLFNANKQCELMFGPGSQVCPYMKQCKRLWCTSAEGIHKGCRTQHMPLADGTECGFFMHCVQGMCVAREAPARVVDGSWGSWGPFTPCSRSCGGGVRSSERDCGKPEPRNGGNYCVGRRMRFRSCSTEPCPKGRRDFRDDQCSEFDGRHFNINGLSPTVRWVSKYSGILLKDRCKLFCRVTGTTAYYQLRDRVMDGTPCGPDTNDICVQGLCRKAGCDHVLNSKARKDKCGVCGGDNSSCHTVSGTFNSVQYGYNEVVRIPAGSMNIEVRQHSYSGKADDDNYLAVRSGQGGYLLNGNFVVSVFKREVRVRGATIDYTGSDTAVERLNCSQRIDEEVVIMVLSVGNLHSPDIRYSFSIPTEEKAQRYTWDTNGAWQECSRTCQGEQHGKVVCLRESDRLVVSEQRCHHLRRPEPRSQGCNTECELRWHVAGRSECSAQCGPGQRSLEVRCVRYGPTKARSDVVDDRHCAELPKPAAREPCHGGCHLTSWQYTSWSQCSQSCAGGARTRSAACVNNLGRRVSNQECDANQRVTSQSCNERPCPQWVASEWTECTATCGKGVRHRRVHCLLGEETLEETFCDAGGRPEAMGTCELPECASWQAGPWGPCSVTCGQGYQMRAMRCFSGFYSTILDDRECNAATRPTEAQDCEQTTCSAALPDLTPSPLSYLQRQQSPTQWRYGSWTPCSASCGKGVRQRYVSCRDVHGGIADPSACLHLTRPPETEACVATACGQWRAGDWTACPVPCGLGRVTRQVLCISHALQLLDESECDGGERPPAERECSGPQCPVAPHGHPAPGTEARPPGPLEPRPFPGYGPQRDYSLVKGAMPSSSRGGGRQWRTGPWGACSSTCAGGIHRRVVVCQDENGYADYHCEERHRPSETQACDAGPCPEWNYGSWGECTKTCGGGTRSRAVLCQLPSGQPLAEQSCEVLERPMERQQCGAQPCPPGRAQDHWHRAAWTPS